MQITSRRQEFELESRFSKMRASFAKKFFVTLCDLLYVCVFNLPLFVLVSYWTPEQNAAEAFKKFVRKSEHIDAWRLLCFSLWIFFFCYVYFVFVPSKTNYQTLFSSNFGIKAITLADDLNHSGKISQKQLFMANFVPVFLVPLLNIIFFTAATISNPNDWHTKLASGDVISGVMRIFVILAVFMQMYHIFTVSASKKTLNWFVRSNGIVYVDTEKFYLVMESEVKPLPTKNKIYVNMPGVNAMVHETLKKPEDFDPDGADFSKRTVV